MKVQQVDPLDEVQLCKDLEKSIKKRFEQLLHDDGYKCRKYQMRYESVRDSMNTWEIFTKTTIFLSLSVFIYSQIRQWIELNDDQKWIDKTYFPWGLVYILISIPIIIIQGPDYSNQSVIEKEIKQLINDYSQIKQLNQEEIPDFDQNYSIENLNPGNMEKLILVSLLIIQFFSDGFYSAITQLVALQYFSEIQRVFLRSIAKTNLSLEQIPGELTEKVQAYFKIWDIKMFEISKNTAWDAFYSILKKQKQNSKQMLQQDGNQIKIIFSDKFQATYNLIKFAIVGSLSIFLAYSIQKSWSKSLIEDKGIFKIEVGPYTLFWLMLYSSEYFTSDNCQVYMMNLRDLYYLKKKFGVFYMENVEFNDQNQQTVAKMYAESNQYQFFNFIVQFWCICYSKPTELILNFCSLNYIYNIDQTAIDRFFFSRDKDFYQRLFNHPWFQYPKSLKKKNFKKFYLYMLNISNNWKPLLQKYKLNDQQIASIIQLELNQQFSRLQFEDGYQLQFIEKSLSFKVRGLVLLLEISYCILMIYDKQNQWNDQLMKETYNDHLLWGIMYVSVTIFMIILQGIGRSEENKTFKKYCYLRKNYINLAQSPMFEWDDNQLQRILCFNYFQEAILISFLLVSQYFLQSFYEILQNVLAFEFLFYLDEHALGTYFRYLYRFENLQKRWQTIPKISKIENQKFENIYRYVWDI